MSDDRIFERNARAWLELGPTDIPDRVVEDVLSAIESTTQERDLRIPWRFPSMTLTARVATAAVIAVLTLGAGFYLLRPQQGIGSPGVSPGTSVDGPGLSASPTAAVGVPATTFTSTVFAVPLSMTLVDGWRLNRGSGYEESSYLLDLQRGTVEIGIMPIAALTVPGATMTDPYVALPTDVAAWVGQRPEFGPATTRAITIGGRTGTLIDADFTWDGSSKYTFLRFYPTAGWLYDRLVAGSRARFIVLPGPGDTGILIHMEAGIGIFNESAASLDRLLATLAFR
jgi:hypothetical protein